MSALIRSSLQRKLVLAFCLLLLLPLSLLSAYTLLRTREALIARASSQQRSLAEARATAAESMLTDVSGDLLFLGQEAALHHFDANQDRLQQVEDAFLNMLQEAGDRYTGLCLLDAGGQERMCVDANQGGAGRRPADQLASRIDTPAFINALRLVSIPGRHPVYISAVDPAGGVAGPATPTIAYSTVVRDDHDEIAGVIVLNVSLGPLIELLREPAADTRTTIVDGAGRFLLRPTTGQARTLGEERPHDAALILHQPRGTLLNTVDRPDTFQTFVRVRPRGHAAIQWTVIYERPVAAVIAEIGQAQGLILLIALVGMAGAALMANRITHGIARPLTVLAAAAERVGAGDLDTPLPPPGTDEIGALTATFARTVGRLRETIAAFERRTREAESLRAAAAALGASLDRPQVLQAILEGLRDVVPYDSASVQLVHDGCSEIIGGYGYLKAAEIIGRSFDLIEGVSPNAEVVARRAAVIYDRVGDHFAGFNEEPYMADQISAWLGVPLIHRDQIIGMITLDRRAPATFNEGHARLVAAFAAHAVVAIENARLYAAAQAELAERRRAEAAHARLAAIIEATTDFVGMADLSGRPLFINRAGRQLIGMGPNDDIASHNLTDYVPPTGAMLFLEQALPTALASGVWSGETELLHRRGHAIPVSQVIIAHCDADGQPEYLSTVVRDISERRRAEEQLRQAQKMEALGRLAGGLAHDFNNILTVIGGECELLVDDLPAESALRPGFDQIHAAAGRASALTAQLLAFSRRQVLQPSVLNLNSCVERSARMLERLIGEDVGLRLDLAADLALVGVDPNQIELVLMNLAINARDAMPDGGRLTINTANLVVPADGMRLAHLAPGNWVRLSVVDTGSGIDSETQAHIFEPFFTTKPRSKGTGLGLATVLGVVQQSGGDVICESTLGRGSQFHVFLPAITVAPIAAAIEPPRSFARAQGAVLLVEDDAAVRSFARAVLERHGCQVHEAVDGTSALSLAAAYPGPIDLLLTDIIMPGGLNGVQLARRVRAARPDIRILYMSGYTDNAQVEQSMATDGASYLQKPFSPAELALALQQAFATPAA